MGWGGVGCFRPQWLYLGLTPGSESGYSPGFNSITMNYKVTKRFMAKSQGYSVLTPVSTALPNGPKDHQPPSSSFLMTLAF